VTELPPRKRNVSMIFQNYAVWPHMTVHDNIAYALKLKRMPKREIERTVQQVAEMTNIAELTQRYPSQLSGGQQQRVAVARAIAVRPQIFLMDEPLSNLDAKLRGSMRTELKTIHVRTEATSVFVTHDQSEAMSMADRIVIMRDGEVVQMGTPEDVYDRSASIFVADFIGTPPTNFLDAELVVENGGARLKNPHFDFSVSSEDSQLLQSHGKKEVIIGIRPENILLVQEQDALLSVRCLISEPQGSHQIVAFELEDKIIKVVAPTQPKILAGETVHLAFKPGTTAYFDKETELRI
jgi:multiple sugar transport system ATP-binding protein